MEKKLAEVVNQTVIKTEIVSQKMCSCENDVVNQMCSSEPHHECGDGTYGVVRHFN